MNFLAVTPIIVFRTEQDVSDLSICYAQFFLDPDTVLALLLAPVLVCCGVCR